MLNDFDSIYIGRNWMSFLLYLSRSYPLGAHKLILSHDNYSKPYKRSLIYFVCSRSWSTKNNLSSAYCKIGRPSSTKSGTTPTHKLVIQIANILAIKLYKIEKSGLTCLSHFVCGKEVSNITIYLNTHTHRFQKLIMEELELPTYQ